VTGRAGIYSDEAYVASGASLRKASCQSRNSTTMKFFISVIPSLLISSVSVVSAASLWSFEDATLSVQTKGAGIGAGAKEK
jgi:hypothetical protein